MKLKRLNPADFNRVADGTRLQERARKLAWDVLVEGDTLTNVAARAGMTKQRVRLAVDVIEKAYFEDENGGTGWVSLELELPESIALQLDDLMSTLKAANDESKLKRAVKTFNQALSKARHTLLQ